jgi:hypothetical protein
MTRRILQSALCLFLAPLLVAQQAAQPDAGAPKSDSTPAQLRIILPDDTSIRILTPAGLSLDALTAGELVQFIADRELTYRGVTLIPAGVPVVGVVAQLQRPSRFRHKDGQVLIRVTESVSGTVTDALLQCKFAASSPSSPPMSASNRAALARILILLAVLVLFILVVRSAPD